MHITFPTFLVFPIKATFFRSIAFYKNYYRRLTKPEIKKELTAQLTHDNKTNVLPTEDVLQVSKKNTVLTLSLNRPDILNAIDIELAQALLVQLKQAATDPGVRVVVITGNGRGFCSGGDLKFALQVNPDQPGDSFMALTSILHACIETIRSMAKPVIAAVNGPAAGAGLFIALACDLRLMADTAYLKVSNPSYGLSLPASGTHTLPRLIGIGRALEMVMLDEPVSARTAQSIGLVSRVVKSKFIYSEAEALAYQLSQKAIHAIGQVKQLMNESYARSLHEQLLAEQQSITDSANHAEGREGLNAFVEKRRPEFAKINA